MDTLAGLVPQVFHDAIARFVPGLATLGTAQLIWGRRLPSGSVIPRVSDSDLGQAAGVLLAAYVLAFVLRGLLRSARDSHKWFIKTYRVKDRKRGEQVQQSAWKAAKDELASTYPDWVDALPEAAPPEPIAIDALRLVNATVGSRLVKLRAEITMCRLMTFSWSVLFLVWLGTDLVPPSLDTTIGWPSPAIPALLALGAFGMHTRRWTLEPRWHRGLYNHWLLVIIPGPLASVDAGRTLQRAQDDG